MMTLAVALVGLLIAAFGLFGMAQPQRLMAWVSSFWRQDRLWIAVAIRLVLGALLIYAAPECRAPGAVRVLGVITVVAALALPLFGAKRMDTFVRWWTERPPAIVRAWSVGALLLGTFLLYAGA